MQKDLNRHCFLGLNVNGDCDAKTIAGIITFQKTMLGLPSPDGLVSPGKRTAVALAGPKIVKPKAPIPPSDPASADAKAEYEPGEVQSSFSSPGLIERTASRVVLYNFGVGKSFVKPEHQRFLNDFIKELKLGDAKPAGSITFLSGYSDAVDIEAKNGNLRTARAEVVQTFLITHATQDAPESNFGSISSTPAGVFLAKNSTREGRARNRAVIIDFAHTLPEPPVRPPAQPPGPSTKSKHWSLQSKDSAGGGDVAAAGTMTFVLADLDKKKTHLLLFVGAGASFSPVPFSGSKGISGATPFETVDEVDVSAFNGAGDIDLAGATFPVLGPFGIGWSKGFAKLAPRVVGGLVDISGFQIGTVNAEVTALKGVWKVIS